MPTSAELYAQAKELEKKEQADRLAKIRAEEKIRMDAHHARINDIAKEFNLNKNQIELIHGKAWEDHHSAGTEEVEWEFRELASLLTHCIAAK